MLCTIVGLRMLPETAPAKLGGKEYADWPTELQLKDEKVDA